MNDETSSIAVKACPPAHASSWHTPIGKATLPVAALVSAALRSSQRSQQNGPLDALPGVCAASPELRNSIGIIS
jgi:hypothetical protein